MDNAPTQTFDNGPAAGYVANFSDIRNIEVVWSESVLADTIVTITPKEGEQFELWLSAEGGGDRIFYDAMTKIWKRSQREG